LYTISKPLIVYQQRNWGMGENEILKKFTQKVNKNGALNVNFATNKTIT
jgi:hypothetical protein